MNMLLVTCRKVAIYLVSVLTRTSYVDELSSIKYILGTLRNSDVKEY
jgi:hypothetical protein